ncbi:hypothetical protein EYF80_024162 [Liparis tanakae]|uniref:Uncharacterized protein n=1 Tax=Liparis tanakae TaxID=230148 RepID=A0A4Z2HKX1_9TELE|nr:hypothetical protein EYF80_024162 [Liparis tanakae]
MKMAGDRREEGLKEGWEKKDLGRGPLVRLHAAWKWSVCCAKGLAASSSSLSDNEKETRAVCLLLVSETSLTEGAVPVQRGRQQHPFPTGATASVDGTLKSAATQSWTISNMTGSTTAAWRQM